MPDGAFFELFGFAAYVSSAYARSRRVIRSRHCKACIPRQIGQRLSIELFQRLRRRGAHTVSGWSLCASQGLSVVPRGSATSPLAGVRQARFSRAIEFVSCALSGDHLFGGVQSSHPAPQSRVFGYCLWHGVNRFALQAASLGAPGPKLLAAERYPRRQSLVRASATVGALCTSRNESMVCYYRCLQCF